MDQDNANDLPSTETSPLGSTAGERIGPYRLLRLLGEGGMGQVWEAEQEKPVRRKVALKLIKWGMDTKAVVARFEAERQALALMNHPNVAKVFDAGATEQGRPYFVMELVKGESITKYCDRQRLTTKERLQLFMQVCEGVQHAHQKGIIHRDVKPSNILVQVEGDKPVPKIIDFGVAKATEQRLTERTVFTEFGQLIGTPEYMSPEQAEMTAQDIDTRTDVYSVGVLLYRLLVGALPFERLREEAFDEIRRRIREEEPSKPSTRLSTLGDASTESAAKRRTDPRSLARQLRGDLDWITMKALEKDRTRRYPTASELAADIRRYMKDEPVSAGAPGRVYRLKKYIKRNKGAVYSAMCLLVVAAVLGAFGMVQTIRLSQEQKDDRLYYAGHTRASDFWAGLLLTIGLDSKDTRRILDVAERTIGGELPIPDFGFRGESGKHMDLAGAESWRADRRIRMNVLSTVGRAYTRLELYDEAIRVLQKVYRYGRIHFATYPWEYNVKTWEDWAIDAVNRMCQNAELNQELRDTAGKIMYLAGLLNGYSEHDMLTARVTNMFAVEFYDLACEAAVRGDPDEAVRALQRLLNLDRLDEVPGTDLPATRRLENLQTDPKFASLHGDPEFEAIVAEVKKHLGEE
jgi:serine/threonine protein kinase